MLRIGLIIAGHDRYRHRDRRQRVDALERVRPRNHSQRIRDRVQVPAGLDEAGLRETALASEKVRRFIDGMQVQDVIVVRGKLVNVVVR